MPNPTSRHFGDPAFVKAMMESSASEILDVYAKTPIMRLRPRPKFNQVREVHARRARKLRRRGEYVHFLRWEHGHCIYGWSGPAPQTIVIQHMPRGKSEPVNTLINYQTRYIYAAAVPCERIHP